MTDSLLSVDGLSCRFGGVWAANGIDLSVAEGDLHALIGPNGAGKSTLIQLICGSLRPLAGSLRFDGEDLTHLDLAQRVARGITRSFQVTQILPQLSALENLRLAVFSRRRDWGSCFRFWGSAGADRRPLAEAEEWLEQVGLAEAAGRRAGELAHGEQRVLELAMALATRPRLLLLDEPLAGMGPEESAHMAALIASLKGRQTILLVEHDMDIVFRLADRIAVLVAGRVIVSDTPEAVRRDPQVRAAYLGDAEVA